ncbi:hypothetical protein HAX54_013896 [Datura stramonium]|uniref:EXS domain-containing protein n=1 Tax=Datura stramonium TaxID=4076 RepID=A0ABS8TPP7_DATST|nr:hypothetical protein [Datura stramonium]
MSSAATVYQLYWDFVKDWGLLQCHSKNPWLRNELMLRRKFIYYFSMALNLVLRLAWLQTVILDFSRLVTLHINLHCHALYLLPAPKPSVPICSLSILLPSDLIPIVTATKSTRSSIIYGKRRASERLFRFPIISCVVEDSSETHSESVSSSGSSDSSKEELPRRSLLATFTCNACVLRSQRLINRLAYERGTVFIQVVLAGLAQLVQVLVRDGAYACASFSCACHELAETLAVVQVLVMVALCWVLGLSEAEVRLVELLVEKQLEQVVALLVVVMDLRQPSLAKMQKQAEAGLGNSTQEWDRDVHSHCGIRNLEVESDSKQLTEWIKRKHEPPWSLLGHHCAEIHRLMDKFENLISNTNLEKVIRLTGIRLAEKRFGLQTAITFQNGLKVN